MNATRDTEQQRHRHTWWHTHPCRMRQATSYHRVQEIQVSEAVPLHGIVSSGCSGFALVLKDEPVFFFKNAHRNAKKIFGRLYMAINVGLY